MSYRITIVNYITQSGTKNLASEETVNLNSVTNDLFHPTVLKIKRAEYVGWQIIKATVQIMIVMKNFGLLCTKKSPRVYFKNELEEDLDK